MLETGARRSIRFAAPEATAAACEDDERALVAAAKRDPAAFAALYDRYAGRVYWFCFRRLADQEAAEDAASLTFAKALAALGSCRDDRFQSWLFGIARNVVLDAHRAHRHDQPLADALTVADPTPGPHEQAAAHDAQRRVASLLARLPEGQRRVVELRLTGLSGKEVAAALGRPHVWVRVTQLRAYERLRRILADEPELLPQDREEGTP
jgi:RNA polymerase sigma-70 factor, ECF subfamily